MISCSVARLLVVVLALLFSCVPVLGQTSTAGEYAEPFMEHARGSIDLACSALGSELPKDRLVEMSGSSYRQLSQEHWSYTAWGSPSCIIRPKSAQEVAKAIKILTRADVQFAIRSGGHSPHPGFSSTNQGVLIDMRPINHVNYDAKTRDVTVGGGAEWQEVYEHVYRKSKRGPVGGRIRGVGVGGLILGGGLSHLSNQYGLAAANVIQFQVVLADGSIATANKRENPDLYWALKGGGNNFGVVTEFVLKTYPVGEDGMVWGGVLIFNNTQLPRLIDAVADYQRISQETQDTRSAFLTHVLPNNNTAIVTVFYNKATKRPKVFEPFFRLEPLVDQTAIVPYLSLVTGDVPSGDIHRWDFRTAGFVLDRSLYREIHQVTMECSKKLGALTGGTLCPIWQPVSSNLVKNTADSPLGLEEKHQLWLGLNVGWYQASDDYRARQISKDCTEAIESLVAKRPNKGIRYLFPNDAGSDQRVLESYGTKNFQKIKKVAEKYDKKKVFQRLVPGGFKVSEFPKGLPTSGVLGAMWNVMCDSRFGQGVLGVC